MVTMNLGQAIKAQRIKLGLTQSELADRLTVGQTYITYMEKNRRVPSNDVLRKLADALELSFQYLYGLAHPDIKNMIVPESNAECIASFPPLLKELVEDRVLRDRFEITDEDVSMLNSIQSRGQITRKEDYIILLMTIRNVFRE